MKRRLALLAATVALLIPAAVSADAGGVPDDSANCEARLQRAYDLAGYGNPAQIAKVYFGGDVQAYKDFLDAACPD